MVANVDPESVYAINKDLKKEDIQQLQEWLKLQPHFPPISETYLQLFLHACYYNNEMAKEKIDNYYTIRAHTPEIFGKRDLRQPELQAATNILVVTPMEKLTPEGYGILYLRLIDFNSDLYKFNDIVNVTDMRLSLWYKEMGCLNGHVIVTDITGLSFGHLRTVGLTTLKKVLYYFQDAVPLRMKAVHFINPVSFMDRIMGMIKPFVRTELFDLIHIHSNLADFYKVIPADCLPKENGGSAPALQELYKASMKVMLENVDELISGEKDITDETKRPGKPKNASDLFGVEGTFKKLDID